MSPNIQRFTSLLLIASCILFYYYFLSPYLTFDNLQSQKTMLQALVKKHYTIAVFIYCGLYAIVTALTLPVSALFTVIGGFLFGTISGTIYATLSATSGGTASFLLVRYLLKPFIMDAYREKLVSFNNEIEQRGFWYVLSLRFFVVIPFFLINILAALTALPLKVFIVATLLGIIPGTFVFAYAGQQLGSIHSLHDILSPAIIIAFLLLGLLATMPLWFRRRKEKHI